MPKKRKRPLPVTYYRKLGEIAELFARAEGVMTFIIEMLATDFHPGSDKKVYDNRVLILVSGDNFGVLLSKTKKTGKARLAIKYLAHKSS